MASRPGRPGAPANRHRAARQPHHPSNCTPPNHCDPCRGGMPRTHARLISAITASRPQTRSQTAQSPRRRRSTGDPRPPQTGAVRPLAAPQYRGRSSKGERSLTAVALPRAPSPQVAVVQHAVAYSTRLYHAADLASGNSLAAVASPQVKCHIGGRNWVRTSDPSLVRRPGPNAVAASENPGHRELITLKARGH